jgi:sortase (surface protein transpeptidase)
VFAGVDERAGVVTSQPVAAGRPPPPAAVAVPSLGVASGLVELGLHADRTLQVPADPAVAGWYVGASRPGEPGPVVVVGHVDSRSGPGVFARLGELVPGSRVELALADGAVAAYEVTGSRQVAKDAFPTEEVYGAVPRDELRLITCGGDFDRGAGSYRDNLVVSAVRV